jgi:hypothetical protein
LGLCSERRTGPAARDSGCSAFARQNLSRLDATSPQEVSASGSIEWSKRLDGNQTVWLS